MFYKSNQFQKWQLWLRNISWQRIAYLSQKWTYLIPRWRGYNGWYLFLSRLLLRLLRSLDLLLRLSLLPPLLPLQWQIRDQSLHAIFSRNKRPEWLKSYKLITIWFPLMSGCRATTSLHPRLNALQARMKYVIQWQCITLCHICAIWVPELISILMFGVTPVNS